MEFSAIFMENARQWGQKLELLGENGDFIDGVVADRMKRQCLSNDEIIARGVGSSSLHKAKRGKHIGPMVTDKLLTILGIEDMIRAALEASNSSFDLRTTGRWHGIHWTRSTKATPSVVARTEWSIAENGWCNVSIPKTGDDYTGRLKSENRRLFCTLTNTENSKREHGDIWVEKPHEGEDRISGAIFGMDRTGALFASPIILSREAIDSEDELNALEDEPELCPKSQLSNSPSGKLESSLRDHWEYGALEEQASKLTCEESVSITTSFFADFAVFRPIVKAAISKGAKVQIVFIDHKVRDLLRARFELRPEYRGASNTNADDWQQKKNRILSDYKNSLRATLQLMEEYPEQISLRFTRHWISSMSIRLGESVLYSGHLFASQSSAEGAMGVHTNPQGKAWLSFKSEFDILWQNARLCDVSDEKFCRFRL